MNRIEAEIKLKEIFKIDHFYDAQWSIIERILKMCFTILTQVIL